MECYRKLRIIIPEHTASGHAGVEVAAEDRDGEGILMWREAWRTDISWEELLDLFNDNIISRPSSDCSTTISLEVQESSIPRTSQLGQSSQAEQATAEINNNKRIIRGYYT